MYTVFTYYVCMYIHLMLAYIHTYVCGSLCIVYIRTHSMEAYLRACVCVRVRVHSMVAYYVHKCV